MKFKGFLCKSRDCALNHKKELNFVILGLMIILPRIIFGWKYFATIDDWFLYYGRSTYENVASTIDLTTRPFAGLADAYVYTSLCGNMFVAQILLSAMLVFSAYFFTKTFERCRISNGAFFMLIFTMVPMGIEALYWIAAASRIISTVFFVSSCAYTQKMYADTGKVRYLIIFVFTSALSVGFYEMLVPVFLIVSFAVAVKSKKKFWLFIISLACGLAAVYYYKANGDAPAVADRVTFVELDNLKQHISDLLNEYKMLLISVQKHFMYETFVDGLSVLMDKLVWLVPIIILLVMYVLTSTGNTSGGNIVFDILFGICIIVGAMLLNVIIAYVRLPFRVVYPVFIGLALIAEAVLCRLMRGCLYKILLFAVSFVFVVCNIGAVSLYKRTYEHDIKYVDNVMKNEKVFDKDSLVYVINEKSYCYNDRIQHFEYVKSVTESYACVTGMIRYRSGINDINNVMMVHEDDLMEYYDYSADNVMIIYFNSKGDENICKAVKIGDNFNIENEYGEFVGSLTLENNKYRYNANKSFIIR